MELTAPEAKLFMAILDRIADQVPEVRYIEQDLGQLETYEIRPAVSWPCCLLDITDFDFSDAGNDLVQIGEGFVQVRVGLVKYTDSNNLTPGNIRSNSFAYMETANKINKALHGWAPGQEFTRLLRRKSVTENREDDIRVKIYRYAISYKEDLTPARQTVARPGAIIGIDKPSLETGI